MGSPSLVPLYSHIAPGSMGMYGLSMVSTHADTAKSWRGSRVSETNAVVRGLDVVQELDMIAPFGRGEGNRWRCLARLDLRLARELAPGPAARTASKLAG